jgi:excisionase family DNA binding protein
LLFENLPPIGTETNFLFCWSIHLPKRVNERVVNGGLSACADGLMRPYPEGAAFLRIGRSKIFALMAIGAIPTVRVFDGGPRRIPKAALVQYLNARMVERA